MRRRRVAECNRPTQLTDSILWAGNTNMPRAEVPGPPRPYGCSGYSFSRSSYGASPLSCANALCLAWPLASIYSPRSSRRSRACPPILRRRHYNRIVIYRWLWARLLLHLLTHFSILPSYRRLLRISIIAFLDLSPGMLSPRSTQILCFTIIRPSCPPACDLASSHSLITVTYKVLP